jgi:hypothetical protein
MMEEEEERVYIHHREFASQMVLDSLFKLINAYHSKGKMEDAYGVCVPAGSCCPRFPTHRPSIVIHP